MSLASHLLQYTEVSLALPSCAALVSPIGHHWFNFLNTAIVGSGLQVGAARVTLDQFVFSPVSPLGNRRRATVPDRLIPSGLSLHPWQHNRILIPSGRMTIFVMDLVRSRLKTIFDGSHIESCSVSWVPCDDPGA